MDEVFACAPSDLPVQDVELPATNGAFYAISVWRFDEVVMSYAQHCTSTPVQLDRKEVVPLPGAGTFQIRVRQPHGDFLTESEQIQ